MAARTVMTHPRRASHAAWPHQMYTVGSLPGTATACRRRPCLAPSRPAAERQQLPAPRPGCHDPARAGGRGQASRVSARAARRARPASTPPQRRPQTPGRERARRPARRAYRRTRHRPAAPARPAPGLARASRAVLTPPAARRKIDEQSLRPEVVCQPCVQCALPLALRRAPCSRCQAEHISSSHAGCSIVRAYTRVRTGRRRATEPAAPSGGAAPWQHGAGWQAPQPPDAARARGARAGGHLGGGHVGGLQRQAGTQRAPQDAQHAPAVERHLVHRERLRRAARCGGRGRRRRRRRRRSDVARRRR